MRRYTIRIVLIDGTHHQLDGLFPTDWDAINAVLDLYETARSIAPRRA